MPIDDAEWSKDRQSQSEAALDRIADMLGCPVKAFTNGAREPLAMQGASELLTIWVEMDSDEDRKRLIEFARQLAAGRRE